MAAPSDPALLLQSLQNSVHKLPELEKLHALLSTLNSGQLAEVASGIFYDVLFECLITSSDAQIKETCVVLEKLFASLDPGIILKKHEGDLLRGLEHPSASVRMLSINQIQRVSETNSQQVSGSPDILRHLVELPGDESLAVAEKASKTFVNLGKNPESLEMVLQPEIMAQLKNTMEINDTVKFRVYEIVVRIANICPDALQMLTSRSDLLQMLCKESQNDEDVLVQLNCLEMLKDLTQTPHGLQFLSSQGVIETFKKALMEMETNPLSGFLLPGLLKFFGNLCYLQPDQVNEDVLQFFTGVLFQQLQSDDSSLSTIAIETIGLLASKPEGKLAFQKQGNAMIYACKNIGRQLVSAPADMRVRCLQAATALVTLKVEEQTADLLTITETYFKALHTDTLGLLLNIAKQPFTELRCSALHMISSIALTSWGQHLLNNHAGFNEYLLDRSTETTKEGKEGKYEIVKTLVNSPTAMDIFGRPYFVKLKQYLNEGPFYLEAEAAVAFEEAS